jgi:hypothetical protein
MPDRKTLSWKALSLGAGAIATLVTRRALGVLWQQLAKAPAPEPVADRRISWVPALSWAVATGVGVSVMNLVAQRSAATVWEAATHETPPPVQHD